jgi:hypothetical protein
MPQSISLTLYVGRRFGRLGFCRLFPILRRREDLLHRKYDSLQPFRNDFCGTRTAMSINVSRNIHLAYWPSLRCSKLTLLKNARFSSWKRSSSEKLFCTINDPVSALSIPHLAASFFEVLCRESRNRLGVGPRAMQMAPITATIRDTCHRSAGLIFSIFNDIFGCGR